MRKARREKRARAAGRRALRGERDERPSPRPQTQTVADSFSRQQIQSREIRAGSGARIASYPTSRRRRGRREGCGAGFRWGWGVFTRRMAVGANEKRPPPAPAFDARHQCVLVRARHHTARDMSLVALCRASPASRAPPPSCPALSTLSRPLTGRRFAGVAISTISLPSPPSHCHLTAISTRSVRSLPHLLYHTRGGGGSGISCASLSSSASGSVVERRSQRSIADALDRKEIGRALRCSAQIDCPVRALK